MFIPPESFNSSSFFYVMLHHIKMSLNYTLTVRSKHYIRLIVLNYKLMAFFMNKKKHNNNQMINCIKFPASYFFKLMQKYETFKSHYSNFCFSYKAEVFSHLGHTLCAMALGMFNSMVTGYFKWYCNVLRPGYEVLFGKWWWRDCNAGFSEGVSVFLCCC